MGGGRAWYHRVRLPPEVSLPESRNSRERTSWVRGVALRWAALGWQGQAASCVALLLYAAMLCYTVPRHEPWADEAQAWQLARTLGLRALFGRYIHYEVTPGLWHFFLWVLVRLGVTYVGMHWISAAIAFGGMVLLVVAAPFPLVFRLLLPFTYFFAYQYAVVARSYVLFGPLLFVLACIWPQRKRRPFEVAVLLSLLANLTFHGLAIAAGLAVVLALEWWPERRSPEIVNRSWLLAGALFLLLACFAAWSVHPPADAQWYTNAQQATKVVGLKGFVKTYPHGYRWYERLPLGLQLFLAFLSRVRFALTAPLGGPPWLGEILWALLLWRWVQEGRLRYAIPVALLAMFCGATRVLAHHVGLVWVLFLFLWWSTSPEERAGRVQMGVMVAAGLCMLLQVRWAVEAVRFDAANPY